VHPGGQFHVQDSFLVFVAEEFNYPRGYTKTITNTKAMNDQTYCNPRLCMDILF
jgi:hypothetical protein